MFISKVEIAEQIKEKILEKHGVCSIEVEKILFGKHVLSRLSQKRYAAIGNYKRYITVFCELDDSTARVVTAYQSTKKQIKFFKKNG